MMMTMCWILPRPAAAGRAGAAGAPPAIAPIPSAVAAAAPASQPGRRRWAPSKKAPPSMPLVAPRMVFLLDDRLPAAIARASDRRGPVLVKLAAGGKPARRGAAGRAEERRAVPRRRRGREGQRLAAEAVALHLDRQAVARQAQQAG